MVNSTQIISYATHEDGYMNALKYQQSSIDFFGIGSKWEGFIKRQMYILNYLENFNDKQIITIIDAYDVLYTPKCHSLEKLTETFKSFNCDILLSVSNYKNSNYLYKYISKKIFGRLNNQNDIALNGGMLMGYCSSLKILINDIINMANQLNEIDDEKMLNVCMNEYSMQCYNLSQMSNLYYKYKNTLTICADENQHIFYNHVSFNYFNCITGKSKSTNISIIENTNSYFYHFIANQNIDNICKHYKLPIGNKINKYSIIKKSMYYSKYFIPEITILTIIIAILTLSIILFTFKLSYKKKQRFIDFLDGNH